MRRRGAWTALLLALVAAPLAAAQPAAPPRDPIIRQDALQKLSDHVYVIPDESTPLVPNVGIIVGEKATLVIDTGLGARNGAIVLGEVAKVSKNRDLYLVTTHVHPEHDLGAQAFPASTRLIRSTDQLADIAENGMTTANAFSQRSALNAELLKGAEFRKADITFTGEHALDLGGVKVRILALGLNHTIGDTAVLVEPDGVLFSGDVAMRAQPSFNNPRATLAQWFRSLDRLEALKPKVVVPSHGPVGDAGYIRGYRAYLTEVREKVAAEKQAGRSQDDTVKAVTATLQPRYPDAGRLGGAIRAAYAEAR